MQKEPILWEAYEHEYREKTRDWYWAIGIITFSISVIAIMLENYIFSIVVLIAGVTLSISSSRPPRLFQFEINRTGISIDGKLTPYSKLRAFWVENNTHHDHQSKLYIAPRHGSAHLLVIPIHDMDPEQIRDYLLDVLREEELHESWLVRLAEYFGF